MRRSTPTFHYSPVGQFYLWLEQVLLVRTVDFGRSHCHTWSASGAWLVNGLTTWPSDRELSNGGPNVTGAWIVRPTRSSEPCHVLSILQHVLVITATWWDVQATCSIYLITLVTCYRPLCSCHCQASNLCNLPECRSYDLAYTRSSISSTPFY